MWKYIYSTLLIGSLLYSCKNDSLVREPIFEYSVKLSHKKISNFSMKLSSLNQIIKIDSFLVITELKASDYMLFIFNLNNGLLYKLGKKGRGPGEIGIPFRLKKSYLKRHFDVYDALQKRILTYDLDSCINDNNYIPELTDVPKSFFDATIVSNKIIIGTGYFEKGMVAVKDVDSIKYYISYPDDKTNVTSKFKAMAYQSVSKVNYNRNMVVLSCFNAGIIKYININDKVLDSYRSFNFHTAKYKPNQQGTSFGVIFDKDNIRGFRDFTFTEKYIYFLYSGRSKEDYKYNSSFANTIWKVNWSGNFICKYILDVDITSLTIDDKDEVLYGIQGHPESNLIKFEIR